MAEYILSNEADQDIVNIFAFSSERFGTEKASAYLSGLDERLQELAVHPQRGRRIEHIRKGYRQAEYVRHSIFFQENNSGIFVVRVLHNRMNIAKQLD